MDKQTILGTAAFILGRKAANDSLLPSLNPFQVGTQEFTDWQLGHQSGMDETNAYANQKPLRDSWESQSDNGWVYAGRTSSRG